MTEKFQKCIGIILRNEGGYVNDPNDPGGETNFGISKRSFPDVDIKALTVDMAKDIYFNNYWNNLGFEGVTPDTLALQMFDMAVNAGSKAAIKSVQAIVGVSKDGILGPDTLQKINSYDSSQRLLNLYMDARIDFYKGIAKSNPKLNGFLRGWADRVKNTIFPS
jgi:lysozyme family protein